MSTESPSIHESSVQGDPAFEIIFQHILSFKNEEGSDASLGQVESGFGHLFHDNPVKGFRPTQEEAHGAHPVQDLADLRLKNHHNDDQDDRPQILENPTGEEKPGPAGQGVENAQGQEGNQDSQGAGPLNPYVESVENISDKKDIDDILPADAQEGFFQVLDLSPPGRPEIIYLITCRRRNPPFKCGTKKSCWLLVSRYWFFISGTQLTTNAEREACNKNQGRATGNQQPATFLEIGAPHSS